MSNNPAPIIPAALSKESSKETQVASPQNASSNPVFLKETGPRSTMGSLNSPEEPTLREKPQALQRVRQYAKHEVRTKYADYLVLTTCFISGVLDSSIYNEYGTFVSMQTGNTIFVGLGASHQNPRPYGWARSGTSIICFVLGCLFFARFSQYVGPKRRRTLVGGFLIQSCFMLLSAGLFQGGIMPARSALGGGVVDWNQEVPIALLSFQAAGQIITARALGYPEVPTVVITSLLCDLISDPKLLVNGNPKRNRRFAAFTLTVIGAIAGGWICKATGSVAAALWLLSGLKLAISTIWLIWPHVVPVPAES